MREVLKYIGAVVVGLLVVASLYNSGSSTSLAGVPTMFDCDGSTHTDDQITSEGIPACGAWGVAILSDHLEYPEGVEAADIERLEMEQALWGYVDQCTATATVAGTGDEFEQEVPCWPMAEPLSRR